MRGVDHASGRWTAAVTGFAGHVLRGHGQVMFLPHAAAGAVFVAALFAGGWEFGTYGLGGAAVGTAAARLLGVARDRVEAGAEGFNSCLFALSCAVFLGPERISTALFACLGAVVVTVVTAAVVRLLRAWDLPALTLPYCLPATGTALAAPAFAHVWPSAPSPAALPAAATGVGAAPAELVRGFFAGVAQVFFLDRWYLGALLLGGLFLASRAAGAAACTGSAAGTATAWALGAPAERVADGSLSCNAVLVALALCGVFLEASRPALLYAVLGAVTATVATPALEALLAPSGGHALTWPFVLTTLTFLAAARSFPRLGRHRPAPGPATTPPSADRRPHPAAPSTPPGTAAA
ncbi:urea transporter [Streptomyces sp. SID8381]|uniref:urea transporter n=1 Tax=unclassified Streptomyces TaxID=2593676 RepID=UPI0003A57C50|nr:MULTISPECIES: urea transporter [unclassified Streptomyces]MYX31117.1 urea transporter [Streptomyces sp. SID8381]